MTACSATSTGSTSSPAYKSPGVTATALRRRGRSPASGDEDAEPVRDPPKAPTRVPGGRAGSILTRLKPGSRGSCSKIQLPHPAQYSPAADSTLLRRVTKGPCNENETCVPFIHPAWEYTAMPVAFFPLSGVESWRIRLSARRADSRAAVGRIPFMLTRCGGRAYVHATARRRPDVNSRRSRTSAHFVDSPEKVGTASSGVTSAS